MVQILNSLNYARKKEKIFLSSIGDVIVAIDRYWNIILWNKTASQITGWSEKEAIGKSFRDIVKFIRERDRKEDVVFIEEAMLYGRPFPMAEGMVLITKDGREIPVGDSASPMFDLKNNISGVIIIFRDLTNEKESRALHSDFAYASHQMRTPINVALWNIENALEEKNIDEIKNDLNIAYLSLKKAHKAAVELIEVSEVDQKMIIPKFQETKLAELMDEIIKKTKGSSLNKEIKIVVSPIPMAVSIETDSEIFKKALLEIVNNAINFGKGAEVRINVIFEHDGILIEVHDFGVGIPENQQTLVFTKFFRAYNVPSDIVGAGLGLYLSREYIRLLKGRIWFKSEENKGTIFYIFLPINPKK
ncbi:PAS domain S-box protein [Candidatus Wolfebacteria bacterium]|nr:PAS domain S-box protein [Candidatus Wolfebacteria bacterium]